MLGPEERVTTEEAFRAITIDATPAKRKENEIGSIEIGKIANFTVFEENPLTADPKELKELAIWVLFSKGKSTRFLRIVKEWSWHWKSRNK